jgi:hypothetical protein
MVDRVASPSWVESREECSVSGGQGMGMSSRSVQMRAVVPIESQTVVRGSGVKKDSPQRGR